MRLPGKGRNRPTPMFRTHLLTSGRRSGTNSRCEAQTRNSPFQVAVAPWGNDNGRTVDVTHGSPAPAQVRKKSSTLGNAASSANTWNPILDRLGMVSGNE